MQISATIITFNEGERIGRCLRSVAWCDEIVVVDSGSTDLTCRIAEDAGARVLRRDWPGYVRQKNRAAEEARFDWILSLDADEELSPRLRAELESLHGRDSDLAGYSMPRLAHYLGGWIRHSGWYPDRKIRLYDRRRGRWTGGAVHESVQVDGPVGRLQGDLLHYTCDSLSEHIQRVDRYTSLAADELAAEGKRIGWRGLTLAPLWKFLRTFIVESGWRDGYRGLFIAQMAAFYVWSRNAKTRERLSP